MTSRREFLKFFPGHILKGLSSFVQSTTEERSPAKPQIPLVARLDISRCLAWAGVSCQLCYVSCPRRDQALCIQDQKPMIRAGFCDGCAMCDLACQTINDSPAITMVPTI